MLGNDLATYPDFPAEIRAPGGLPSGRFWLPAPFRRPRHPHAGRRAERARRHEPGRPEDESQRSPAEWDPRRRQRCLHRPEPDEGRLRRQSDRGRFARGVRGARDPADLDDDRGAEGDRRDHEARGRACEEHVRARAHVVALRPADRGDDRVPRVEVREATRDRGRERKGIPDRLRVRRDDRGIRRAVRGEACRAEAGPLPQHHRKPGARVRTDRRFREVRAAALPRRVPDHARIVRARGARAPQELRRAHVPGRGRDRGGRRGARRELRWLTRRVDVERSRHRAEAGDDRARHHARVAARDRRRPASRPVDGHADEARAGRPARSDVRPQFRVTRPGDRRRDAERLLRRSAGSGAHRDQVPHAGVPALGRLPGERLRALAAARRRRDPGDRAPLRTRGTAKTSSPTGATRRRWRGRGRFPARRASSTASVASRSRMSPATSATTPTTTT